MKSDYGGHRPIGTHQRSFERYHSQPLTCMASSSPRLGVRNPHPKI